MNRLKLLTSLSELGAGTRGASLGFEALKVSAFNAESKFFARHKWEDIPTANEHLLDPVDTPNGIRISAIADQFDRIEAVVSRVLGEGDLPLIIGGDHSVAGGTLAGIHKAYPNERIGVVWIDAHADLHSPYTTPSGNVHGMPLATALAMNNEANQINDVRGETLEAWNRMKGDAPRVRPEDLFFIAVRDTEEPEDNLIADQNIVNYRVGEVHNRGGRPIAREIMERLSDCDRVYISFDVDSMDATISMGTGTPVHNGIWESEAEDLLTEFASYDKVCCMEFVEINPCLDTKGNVMADTAFQLLEKTALTLENRLKG
ncbi:arginase [Cryomorphaceae bacterium]|nr:arginase [Cryomorphaceae bacterium]